MNVKIEPEFRQSLTYLLGNKKGRIKTLENNIPASRVHQYESIGFINTGCTSMGNKTYSTTPLAKRYYKDLYGTFAYLKISLKNFLKR